MKKLLFSLLLFPGTITVFAQKTVVIVAAGSSTSFVIKQGHYPDNGSQNPGSRSKSAASTMPSRLSMTPTTTRQTQGRTFGEKTGQGIQAADVTNFKGGNQLYKCDYCGELFETDDQMLEHQVDCKKAHPNAKSISEKD